jgi:hypothetical protein
MNDLASYSSLEKEGFSIDRARDLRAIPLGCPRQQGSPLQANRNLEPQIYFSAKRRGLKRWGPDAVKTVS